MRLSEKVKSWFIRNRKYILLISGAVLVLVGVGVGYILHNNKKMSLEEWLKIASTEDLNEAHENLRVEYIRTGVSPYGMEQIGHALSERNNKEWFKNHPPITDPDYRWKDANRWERD